MIIIIFIIIIMNYSLSLLSELGQYLVLTDALQSISGL